MNYQKEELIQILREKNYAIYSVICLDIKKVELFRPIFYLLSRQEIIQVINSLNEESLETLLNFLAGLTEIEKYDHYLFWVKFLLYFKSEMMSLPKFTHFLMLIKEKVKKDLEEFQNLTQITIHQLDFLKNQLSCPN